MPSGDGTGPRGQGPYTGRSQGYGAGYSSPGNQRNRGRSYDGRGSGKGNRPIRNTNRSLRSIDDSLKEERMTGIEGLINGPGGHTPDGTGPYGRGMGPGNGKQDGSGLEYAERTVKKYYGHIYSKYDVSASEIISYHNEAVKKKLHGSKRRDYVANKVMASKNKRSKNARSSRLKKAA